MAKPETLKLNRQFKRAYGRGKCFVFPELVTYIARNRHKTVRYGITAGKKLGSAVRRNRARRVITAAFRECLPHVKGGFDIVFVARVCTPDLKSYDVARAVRRSLTGAGAWISFDETNTDQAD